MRKGDIVLVRFPFSNLSGVKLRPALVLIGTDEHGEVCLAFISSRVEQGHEFNLLLTRQKSDFRYTGLKVDSVVRLNKIVTLHRDLIAGRLGRLSAPLIWILDQKLARVFNIKSQDRNTKAKHFVR